MFLRCLLPLVLALNCAAQWPESTPEAQGLDSQTLADMVSAVAAKHLNVHSIAVIRHGNIVLDSHFYPYKGTEPHDAASVTKAITSVVVGIAIDKGLLKLDQKVLASFPNEAPANPDPRESRITVADLLSMQAGLDCGFAPGEKELGEMKYTSDWIKFTLALPMKYDPGTKYAYCSPGFHLLSGMITAATHEPELDFARKNLFDPMGMKDVTWTPDPKGLSHGWGDSHFYPRDFAKFGSLYLHDGKWNGKQIVSADWVHKSLTAHADQGRGNSFGYGWVIGKYEGMDEFGYNGRGGQRVAVWPAKDMIIVITGSGYPAAEIMAPVLKSVQADAALPSNAAGDRALKTNVANVAKTPAAEPVADLPPMAKTISGAVYEFPRNTSRLDGLSLTFEGKTEAQLKVKYIGADLLFPVGLDGVYRLTHNGGATGKWTSPTDFLLDLNFIHNINHYTLALHFEGDEVQMTANESSGLVRNGHVTGKKITP